MRWILLLFVPTIALAGEAPQINFQGIIVDYDGKSLSECIDDPLPKDDRDCKSRKPLTLGIFATRALLMPEQGISPEESFKRAELARKVYQSSGVALTSDDITLIKKQIAKAYSPLVVGQTFPLLDPAMKDK